MEVPTIVIVALMAVTFPIAIVIAWAMTPSGLWKRLPPAGEFCRDQVKAIRVSCACDRGHPSLGVKAFLGSQAIFLIPTKMTGVLNGGSIAIPYEGVRLPLSWVTQISRICCLFTVLRVQLEGGERRGWVMIDCSSHDHRDIVKLWRENGGTG